MTIFQRAVEALLNLSILHAEARTGIRHDVVLTRPFIQDPGR
jgi:hypothetical protein